MAKGHDECRARGCGGWLDCETIVYDGHDAYCRKCGRRHIFHVSHEGATPIVVPDRKPRKTTGKIRGRGGKGGWVSR